MAELTEGTWLSWSWDLICCDNLVRSCGDVVDGGELLGRDSGHKGDEGDAVLHVDAG